MTEPGRPLPDFNAPPVIETVLGVQFNPLQKFSIQHYGLYFQKVRGEYPKCVAQPPLDPVVERFDIKHLIQPAIGIEFGIPDIRCWFIDNSDNRLIQLQRDRFIYNWRESEANNVYPRYHSLKPKFEEEWQKFCKFLDEEKIERPEVNQCEVTYINHIEIDSGWQAFGEADKIIKFWIQEPKKEFLPKPEKVNILTRYVMHGNKGRLHINLQPAIRKRDAKEIFQLVLTARGIPASSKLEDILGWFDLGHEWIVRGFADFTTEEMHKIWGRKL